MNPDLRVALACAAGLLLLLYVVPMVRLKIRHRAGAHLHFAPTSREHVNARFLALIDPLLAALDRMGFTLTGYLDGPGDRSKPSGIRHTVVLRSADATTAAIVYVIERATPVAQLTANAQFVTDFRGGDSINTSNSPLPALFYYPAGRRVYRFPGATSVAALYDLHRRLVARMNAPGVMPQPSTVDEVMRKIQETTARNLAYQEERGAYARTADGDYGFTWKGAARAVALMGPGLKRLWQARQRGRAADLAAELLRDPPPG